MAASRVAGSAAARPARCPDSVRAPGGPWIGGRPLGRGPLTSAPTRSRCRRTRPPGATTSLVRDRPARRGWARLGPAVAASRHERPPPSRAPESSDCRTDPGNRRTPAGPGPRARGVRERMPALARERTSLRIARTQHRTMLLPMVRPARRAAGTPRWSIPPLRHAYSRCCEHRLGDVDTDDERRRHRCGHRQRRRTDATPDVEDTIACAELETVDDRKAEWRQHRVELIDVFDPRSTGLAVPRCDLRVLCHGARYTCRRQVYDGRRYRASDLRFLNFDFR